MERQARQSARRRRNLGSSLIFAALAVVLIAIAAYYYVENDEDEPATAEPPNPITVGRIEVVNVQDALRDQDLDAITVPASVRSAELSTPGQGITIGAETLYVFVYPTVAAREADSEGLDLERITLISRGTPVAGGGGPPYVSFRGNVIVVLPGGDADLREQVDAAMASLPDVGSTPEAAWSPGSLGRS